MSINNFIRTFVGNLMRLKCTTMQLGKHIVERFSIKKRFIQSSIKLSQNTKL